MIAGSEYLHYDKNVNNKAFLQLTDNRLGFNSAIRIWQNKNEPAPSEEKELLSKFGLSFDKEIREKKYTYIHNNFHFGLMICSEVQNSKERISFQGNVDALIILSWNQDIDTFSSLIESTALDVHAYTIVVNNRKYGDSRVRSPSKKSYLRDIARVRGGKKDYCVYVELDIDLLRRFQSRSKRWPDDSDPFKPLPEGYVMLNSRKKLPPI